MDIRRFIGDPEKGKFSGSKKYSTTPKDIKKKLSCINRRINDLHQQKKSLYKNSVKVKKMAHNQINQIVRCFRARERSICSDVDEVYFSEDASISEELSKLQSVYAHGQAVLNHIEDFKEKSDILRNIDIILSEINFGEKADVKPLQFLSDFEMMKVKATGYGYLEGDFVKKDDFVYIDEEKDSKSSDNCKNKEFLVQDSFAAKNDTSNKMSPLYKTTDIDDFQIIDLLDNMKCQDADNDFAMHEDRNVNGTLQNENKLNEPTSSESTFKIKEYNTLKGSFENHERNIGFNPEEEWKQILEMNKKLASWHEMTPKETVSNPKEKENTHDKNCNANSFLLLKEANSWLYHYKYLEMEETPRKITGEMKSTSPAEIIKESFKCYMAKDDIKNWLSAY